MNTQPFPEEMLRKIREDQRAGLPGRCPKCGGPLVKDTSPNVPGRAREDGVLVLPEVRAS